MGGFNAKSLTSEVDHDYIHNFIFIRDLKNNGMTRGEGGYWDYS